MSGWKSRAVPVDGGSSGSDWRNRAELIQDSEDLFSLEQLGRDVLENVVVPVGKAVDSVTGAPSRAAVSALAQGANPISAFLDQFAEDPEAAPTGREHAQALGVPETSLSDKFPDLYSPTGEEWLKLKKGGWADPTASGAVGLGLDFAEDWTNIIPGAMALKAAGKGAGKVASGIARKAAPLAAKATDLATGTEAASKAVRATGKAATKAKDAFDWAFNPVQSPEFARSTAVAIQNGIDPKLLGPSIEFGKGSVISRAERVLAEGPTGQKLLEKHMEGLRQIQDATGRKFEAISGGPILSEAEAGTFIRDQYWSNAEQFFREIDLTHDKIQKYAPGLMVHRVDRGRIESALKGVEKYAKGRVQRGITDTQRGQGTQLLRAVQAIRNGNGSYKQTVEALRNIGDVAFGKMKNSLADVPPDIENLRDLYFKLDNALIETVRKDVNPEFAEELIRNNKAMSEFFKNRSVVADAIGSKSLSDEGLFRNLILNGDSKKIGALRKLLSESALQRLKGTFISSLVKRNADGGFNFDSLYSALQNKKNVVQALFTPQEISEITDLIKLGRDHGLGIMSTSGTGASNAFRDMLNSVPRAIMDEEILSRLKSRARGTPPPGGGGPSAPKTFPQRAKQTVQSLRNRSRGPVEKRLKAAQTISPSFYDDKEKRKRRLKALED